MSIETAGALFLLILFLAHFTQSLVEAVLGEIFNLITSQKVLKFKGLILRYTAMAVGAVLAFLYQLDLIYITWTLITGSVAAPTGLKLPNIEPSSIGFLLTGLGIGQGAIWLHELVKKILPNIPDRLGGT